MLALCTRVIFTWRDQVTCPWLHRVKFKVGHKLDTGLVIHLYTGKNFSHSEAAAISGIELTSPYASFPVLTTGKYCLLLSSTSHCIGLPGCFYLCMLYFIQTHPFANRGKACVCSNYRTCCPFHLCLHNPV